MMRRPGDVSDHIRYAVEQYVIAEESRQATQTATPLQS